MADLSFEFFCQLISIEDDAEDKISTIGDVGGAMEIKKILKIQCIYDLQKETMVNLIKCASISCTVAK